MKYKQTDCTVVLRPGGAGDCWGVRTGPKNRFRRQLCHGRTQDICLRTDSFTVSLPFAMGKVRIRLLIFVMLNYPSE